MNTEYGQYTKHIRVNCKTVDMAVGDFFFTPWVLLLITKECHDKFFIDFNFFDGKFSWNILITKVLSYRNIRASEMEIHYIDKVDVAKCEDGYISDISRVIACKMNVFYALGTMPVIKKNTACVFIVCKG